MNLKENATKLKKDIPALWLALKHPDTPLSAKILAAITVGYALSPIDLVPDFIPVLGYLDDVILLPFLAYCTMKRIPQAVLEECSRDADGLWQDGKPKKWYYALPIALIWALILRLIVKAIWF